MSLIDEMFEELSKDYSENYSKENLIKFCYNCGGKDFYESVTDREDYIELERQVLCKKCGDRVNYWAYGIYENDMSSESYKKMLRQKKLERLLHGCPICKESKGEKEIRKKLDLLKIKYITQKRFDGCKYKYKLPFDFYLQDYNCCIEFDGIQHFKPIKKWGGTESLEITKIKDEIKTTYCFNNNIKLLRIRYDEIIEQKLNEFLGEKNC